MELRPRGMCCLESKSEVAAKSSVKLKEEGKQKKRKSNGQRKIPVVGRGETGNSCMQLPVLGRLRWCYQLFSACACSCINVPCAPSRARDAPHRTRPQPRVWPTCLSAPPALPPSYEMLHLSAIFFRVQAHLGIWEGSVIQPRTDSTDQAPASRPLVHLVLTLSKTYRAREHLDSSSAPLDPGYTFLLVSTLRVGSTWPSNLQNHSEQWAVPEYSWPSINMTINKDVVGQSCASLPGLRVLPSVEPSMFNLGL